MDTSYDVVVVGGGAAGLSGALALGRARRSVLVLDAGNPRNAPAKAVHNYLTSEGVAPGELVAAGRAEVSSYGVRVRTATVTAVRQSGSGFQVDLADGDSVRARRLLVATGLRDELPEVPGVAERWGRDVLHCPYCHGWEVRDQAIGILGTGPMAVHSAQLFRQWSPDVILFRHTAPELSEKETEELAVRGVIVVDGEVAELEVADDRLTGVRMRSGEVIAREAVVVTPAFRANTALLAPAGLAPADFTMAGHVIGSHLPADATGATSVPGIWVAGNITDPGAQVINSAAAGLKAGAAINNDLIKEDTDRAVAFHRWRHNVTGGALHDAEGFWETFYQRTGRVWSGKPNPVLVDLASTLPPGRALDLGCGEGADAIWLAGLGWQVTAVDVSDTALRRAANEAAAAGVADRIDFQRHDLASTFPDGEFELVSAQYLQSPVEFPRDRVLRTAAGTVAPDGLLLVVEHGSHRPWASNPEPAGGYGTPDELLAGLDLKPDEWHTERLQSPERQATGPNGESVMVTDNIVALRRVTA
jgi:thioredoxin reductase/SAM-dependent methyltransferase